jgi:hypothetical protein
MVKLYLFIKVLEEDYNAIMRGVSVKYGSQTKLQVPVSCSIGWAKPKEQNFQNNGCPPDTTNALLGPPTKKIKKNPGRPKYSVNVDCNPYTTYQLYTASSQAHLMNRCWMSAAMESLFAFYSPLLMRHTSGSGSTLFEHLVHHFCSQTTYNLTQVGKIQLILTNGQNKLFNSANNKLGAWFEPGQPASCNYFIELLLSPLRSLAKLLKGLFEMRETHKFSCGINH